MLLTVQELILLAFGFFVVATLYSSVGFGGGSSYLAILTLVLTSFFAIRSTALVCNLIVVSGSTYLYFKNGHFHFKKFLPFVLMSIPFAFIGARFRLEENVFFIILGGAFDRFCGCFDFSNRERKEIGGRESELPTLYHLFAGSWNRPHIRTCGHRWRYFFGAYPEPYALGQIH